MLPIVALIGKPNVGKSSLFNRLIGEKKAVVSPTPGTTRDRLYHLMEGKKPFLLVDTGGLMSESGNPLEQNVQDQASAGLEEATLLLFLIEAKKPITKEDYFVADVLRKKGKPVFLVMTKSDTPGKEFSDAEVFRLGFGAPLAVSAIHGFGISELQKKIQHHIPKGTKPERKSGIRIVIIGRPNVGKSSLTNALAGSEKMIVSEIPGTTRDRIDLDILWKEDHFTLIDTPGIRKRGKIQKGMEHYSVLRAIQGIETADIGILLIDGKEGVTAQDLHLSKLLQDSKIGVILAVNKMDFFGFNPEVTQNIMHTLQHRFSFLRFAPVVFLSAKTGKNVDMLFTLAKEIQQKRSQYIPKSILQKWLNDALALHPLSSSSKSPVRCFDIEQQKGLSPRFLITTRYPEKIHFSFARFLENKLRENFDFTGIALELRFVKKIF